MEHFINIHIEKLVEGMYLATSEDVQGMVAQGRTIQETLEIARDLIKKLLEAQGDKGTLLPYPKKMADSFDYPLVIGF